MSWHIEDLLKDSKLAACTVIHRCQDRVTGSGNRAAQVEAVRCDGAGFTTESVPLLSIQYRRDSCDEQDEQTCRNQHSQLHDKDQKTFYDKEQFTSLLLRRHDIHCVWESSLLKRLDVREVAVTHDNQEVTRVLGAGDDSGLQLGYSLTALLCLHVLMNEATLGHCKRAMLVHDFINSEHVLSHNYVRPLKPGSNNEEGPPIDTSHINRFCPTPTLVQRLTAAPARFINKGCKTTAPTDQLWLEVSALLKRQRFELGGGEEGRCPRMDDLEAAIRELQKNDVDAWEPDQLLKCISGTNWRGVWKSYLSDKEQRDQLSDGNVSICLKCGLGGGDAFFPCALCSHAYHGECLRTLKGKWSLTDKEMPVDNGEDDWLCPPCNQLNKEAPVLDGTAVDTDMEDGGEAGPSSRPGRPPRRRSSTRQADARTGTRSTAVDIARRANGKRTACAQPTAHAAGGTQQDKIRTSRDHMPGKRSQSPGRDGCDRQAKRQRQPTQPTGQGGTLGNTGSPLAAPDVDVGTPPHAGQHMPCFIDLSGADEDVPPHDEGVRPCDEHAPPRDEDTSPHASMDGAHEGAPPHEGMEGADGVDTPHANFAGADGGAAPDAGVANADGDAPADAGMANADGDAPANAGMANADGVGPSDAELANADGSAPPDAGVTGADESVPPHASPRSTLAGARGPDLGAGSSDAPQTPDILTRDRQVPNNLLDLLVSNAPGMQPVKTAQQLIDLETCCDEATNQIGELWNSPMNLRDYLTKVFTYVNKARQLLDQAATQQLKEPETSGTLLRARRLMNHVKTCLQPCWLRNERLRDAMVERPQLL